MQSPASLAHSYRFQCELTNQPAEGIYLITQRSPRCPSCHGVTRWHRSLSHLSWPTDALQTRRSTDCDSCVTSQAQQAMMLSQAPAVLRPIWPFANVRMQWLHECSVGYLTICDKCLTILPTFQSRNYFTLRFEIVTWLVHNCDQSAIFMVTILHQPRGPPEYVRLLLVSVTIILYV